MANDAQIYVQDELMDRRKEFDTVDNLELSGGVATKPFLRSVSIIKKILEKMEKAAIENRGFHFELFYDEESPTVKYYFHTVPKSDDTQSTVEEIEICDDNLIEMPEFGEDKKYFISEKEAEARMRRIERIRTITAITVSVIASSAVTILFRFIVGW